MSNFVTVIPVDVEAVRKLLPAGSHVESAEWNGTAVELKWSHHKIETAFTFHLEFPMEHLKAQRLPEGAHERKERPRPAPGVMTPGKPGVERKGAQRKRGAPR